LTEVLRQLGEAFANAAGSRGGPVGQQLPQTHFPTAAGIDLLQVRSGMMLVLLCLVVMCCGDVLWWVLCGREGGGLKL
jgi:hypothetical protein